MALYYGNIKISNLKIGSVDASGSSITLSAPSISVSSAGLITSIVTQNTSGYLSAGSKTSTYQLTTLGGSTITPKASEQTAGSAGNYLLGAIKIAAVPTETKTITSNGTYTPTSGKWFSSVTVNVPVGSTITNQDKTVTPATSAQAVTFDSGYTGLGTVTVEAIPSTYIIPSGNKAITANGTNIDVKQYATVSVNVPTGSTINNQNKSVTPTESSQIITADSGYTGLGTVTVGAISSTYVGSGITTRTSSDLTVSGATISAPAGYYASAASKAVASGTTGTPSASKGTVSNNSISITPSVTNTTGYITGGTKTGTAVTVSASELVSGNKAITANGTNIDVTNYKTVSVAVPSSGTTINNQDKTVTPSESQQMVSADSGYTGLGTVTINAINSTYVGSGVTQRTSSDLTVSGATVSAPAGYYASSASKSVATMTLPTAASSSSSGISKATIGRSTSAQYINIPVGYNSTAAYYTISAVANGSAATPVTTITANPTISISSTGLITASVSGSQSVTPTVSAGYVSAGTAGTISVSGSKTQQLTTKTAATITPGTTNQTIASGTYLIGTQTIAGDADLVAGNIKSGVSIFGVTGTYSGLDTSDATATAANINNGYTAYVNGVKVTGTQTFATIYTGSSAPSSSTGSNGDVYLVLV